MGGEGRGEEGRGGEVRGVTSNGEKRRRVWAASGFLAGMARKSSRKSQFNSLTSAFHAFALLLMTNVRVINCFCAS